MDNLIRLCRNSINWLVVEYKSPRKLNELLQILIISLAKRFNIFVYTFYHQHKAICLYILMISIPFTIFLFLDDTHFRKPPDVNDIDWLDKLYFSVVTITTLGYGDISPKSTWVKVLVMFQAFSGPLLLGYFLSVVFRRSAQNLATNKYYNKRLRNFSRVQQINSRIYANLDDLLSTILMDADHLDDKEIRFHSSANSFYSDEIFLYPINHRLEQSKIFICTFYRVDSDFKDIEKLKYVERINADWMHLKSRIERTYSVEMLDEFVNNDLRNQISRIVGKLEDVSRCVALIRENMDSHERVTFYKDAFFQNLWLTLQYICKTLTYLENLPGVEVLDRCEDSQLEFDSEFKTWMTKDITQGISFISTFDSLLDQPN